jgi:hypothetical protein
LDSPYEVKELIKDHCENLSGTAAGRLEYGDSGLICNTFYESEKALLDVTVKHDRLSVLADASDGLSEAPTLLSSKTISPRCLIPKNYRLFLMSIGDETMCKIILKQYIEKKWVVIPLTGNKPKNNEKTDKEVAQ